MTAPALSIALCRPKAYPLFDLSATSESQASRGGPRKLLPKRSMILNEASAATEVPTKSINLAKVEKTVSDQSQHFSFSAFIRQPAGQIIQGKTKKNRETFMRPSKAAEPPTMTVKKHRKNREDGFPILMSVKKLTSQFQDIQGSYIQKSFLHR